MSWKGLFKRRPPEDNGYARLRDQDRHQTAITKTVHVYDSGMGFGIFQAKYLDRGTNWLYPNICMVDENGEILFQTNNLRLRGPDVNDRDRLAVVWGDSVVFGVGPRSWPELLNQYTQSYVFLNGGVEGTEYTVVLKRAVEFNEVRPAALNLLFLGWHPFPDNSSVRSTLLSALSRIPNAVLLTLPTCLNGKMIQSSLEPLFRSFRVAVDWRDYDEMFGFIGSEPYSIEKQMQYYDYIVERNDIIRRVAAERDIPLIDLYAFLDTASSDDITADFFDILHLRARAQPKVAKFVWEELQRQLRVPA